MHEKGLKYWLDEYVKYCNKRTNIENKIFSYLVGMKTDYDMGDLVNEHSDTIDMIDYITDVISNIRGNDSSHDEQILDAINSIQSVIRQNSERIYNDCRL